MHLANRVKFLLTHYENKLSFFKNSRALTKPQEIFEERIQQLDELFTNLQESLKNLIKNKENSLSTTSGKLNLLSPLNILGRGYSICWKESDNKIIRKSSDLKVNDKLKIRLHKGSIFGKVEKIQ